MTQSGAHQRYAPLRRALHWSIAALIAAMVGAALLNRLVYENAPLVAETALRWHMTLGVFVFVLTLARLFARLKRPIRFEDRFRALAEGMHVSLYVLILALIATGYLKMALLGYPVLMVGGLSLPALPFLPTAANLLKTAHQTLALVMAFLVAGHVAAALFHKRLFGVAVLQRML